MALGKMLFVRVALVVFAALALVALPRWRVTSGPRVERLARWALGLWAAGQCMWLFVAMCDHVRFPLNLEPMESTLVDHLRRLAGAQALYAAPDADFVALAYNPLYYVVALPLARAVGPTLGVLRAVSVTAVVGSALVMHRAVRAKTEGAWWALSAVGLFAAAYAVMDAYLDTVHSDACMLVAVLGGTHLLDRRRDALGVALGLATLAAGFWFKQHGALFAAGGLVYVALRDGPKRAALGAALLGVLGPALYVFAGPRLFGSHFHSFTWEVPRRWSQLDLAAAARFAGFFARNYGVLAALAAWETWREFEKPRAAWSAWHVQLGAALASGLLGALDADSSDNVFIPLGVWFIVLGALGLARLARAPRAGRAHLLALAAAYAALLYNPRDVWTSREAPRAYADLRAFVRALPGTVYMPWQGVLPERDLLSPTAHQIALEDMVRGPGRDPNDAPLVRRILAPVTRPRGAAWVLTHRPLEDTPTMGFLLGCYAREADLGERFKPLEGLPKRFFNGWPRYLYRYAPTPGGRCP